MKKLIYLCAVFAMFGLASCSDDDENGVQLQNHDDNEMMARMHSMMSQMEAMTPSNDPDIDFAQMMIMHHQGAIDMANLELEGGSDEEMMAKAQSIINEQQQEIEDLQAILNGLTVDETDTMFPMEQMNAMHKMGTDADTQLITGNIDNDFATLMMVHHQAAIDNASAYLHHGSNPELQTMATSIVEMQTQEIIELGNWLIDNRR